MGRTGGECQTETAVESLAYLSLREGLELTVQDFRPKQDMTLFFSRETAPIHFGYLIKGHMHTVVYQGQRCFFNAPNGAGNGGVMYLPHTNSQGHYQANCQVLAVAVDVSPQLFGELAGEALPCLPCQLRDLARGGPSCSGFVLPSTITARMNGVLHDILSIRQGAPCAGLYAEAKALELLSLQIEQLIQSPGSSCPVRAMDSADKAGVQRALEMLRTNLQNPPSLLDMSREAGMSHSKLNRCFKQTCGLTAFEWLRQARLHKAKELLDSGCPLAEVALRSGFSDQSHLNRCFKRHFGVTPGEFRRSRRG